MNSSQQDLTKLKNDLKNLANPKKAKILQGFFKTGIGEYGEGDIFLGVTVPNSRSISQKYYKEISMENISGLLHSKIHEERLVALQMLRLKFQKGDENLRKTIYNFYLSHTNSINNWDLIDGTADAIVGFYLFEHQKNIKILEKLALSKSVWEKRIAIIATYYFLKKNSFDETYKIAEILLNDTHDLIHKAVGWMLREVGKRCSQDVLEGFLKKHYKTMPRTMLRYAIERFEEKKRKAYLRGTV